MLLYALEAARSRSAAGARRRGRSPAREAAEPAPWTGLSRAAAKAMAVGFVAQTAAIVVRAVYVGRIPITTFFGYLSVLSWLIVLAYLIVLYKYRWTTMGAYIAPVAFLVIVIASLFPMKLEEQLIPALQSYWLQIHVTIALLGEAAFAVGFAAGLLYLVRDFKPAALQAGAAARASANLAGAVIGGAVVGRLLFGDALAGTDAGSGLRALSALGTGLPLAIVYAAVSHRWVVPGAKKAGFGGFLFAVSVIALFVGGVVTAVLNQVTGFVPAEHGRVSVFAGALLLVSAPVFAGAWRLLAAAGARLPKAELLDEVEYRAIATGWPLFTVGALIAGAIWAHQAWGVYWSWDPKEVGSLVVWLVYALYLHARARWGLRAGWSAVTAVLGFCAAVLTLVGNLVLGGLHSYG